MCRYYKRHISSKGGDLSGQFYAHSLKEGYLFLWPDRMLKVKEDITTPHEAKSDFSSIG